MHCYLLAVAARFVHTLDATRVLKLPGGDVELVPLYSIAKYLGIPKLMVRSSRNAISYFGPACARSSAGCCWTLDVMHVPVRSCRVLRSFDSILHSPRLSPHKHTVSFTYT
jgi:hypothetical protein